MEIFAKPNEWLNVFTNEEDMNFFVKETLHFNKEINSQIICFLKQKGKYIGNIYEHSIDFKNEKGEYDYKQIHTILIKQL